MAPAKVKVLEQCYENSKNNINSNFLIFVFKGRLLRFVFPIGFKRDVPTVFAEFTKWQLQ